MGFVFFFTLLLGVSLSLSIGATIGLQHQRSVQADAWLQEHKDKNPAQVTFSNAGNGISVSKLDSGAWRVRCEDGQIPHPMLTERLRKEAAKRGFSTDSGVAGVALVPLGKTGDIEKDISAIKKMLAEEPKKTHSHSRPWACNVSNSV
ncbi:hypothetical protein CRD17_01325 [Corynebacterium sp. LK30]|nr:hypothetical protein [Corynebacterium sp. LK30]